MSVPAPPGPLRALAAHAAGRGASAVRTRPDVGPLRAHAASGDRDAGLCPVYRAAEQTGGRACLRAGRPPAGRPSPPPAAPGSGCGEGTRGATAVLRGTGKTGNSRSDDLARGRPGGSAQASLRLPHGASWAVRVLLCPCGGGVAQTCPAPREPAAYLLAHGAFLCVCSLSLPSRRPRGRWAWTDAPRGPTTARPPPPVPGAAREGIRGGLYQSWSNGRSTHHCSVLSARIAGQK